MKTNESDITPISEYYYSYCGISELADILSIDEINDFNATISVDHFYFNDDGIDSSYMDRCYRIDHVSRGLLERARTIRELSSHEKPIRGIG